MSRLERPATLAAEPLGPSRGWLALAAAAVAAVPVLGWWASAGDPAAARPEPAPAVAEMARPVVVPTPVAPQPVAQRVPAPPPAQAAASTVRDPDGDTTPDLSDMLNPGEKPTMAEVISRLRAAGVTGGLAAFQPPGTRPPLVGLAVPDDFELPPGFVRHHQVTDDGQRIEAILMFSPDHPWVDAQGRRLQLPTERVVPVELAPPGLPIRRIVVPPPIEPGR